MRREARRLTPFLTPIKTNPPSLRPRSGRRQDLSVFFDGGVNAERIQGEALEEWKDLVAAPPPPTPPPGEKEEDGEGRDDRLQGFYTVRQGHMAGVLAYLFIGVGATVIAWEKVSPWSKWRDELRKRVIRGATS